MNIGTLPLFSLFADRGFAAYRSSVSQQKRDCSQSKRSCVRCVDCKSRAQMNSHEIQTAPVVSGDLSHFYWLSAAKVSIVLTCGAASGVECLQIFKSGKKLLRFCASGPYLNELIGYENLMDCPEILPDNSLAIKHKNRVGDLLFSKLVSRNGLRRNMCRCIFGHQT